jgi:prepilin-type N-terminal cleavage/methylation domain-containing protein
MVKMSSRRGYSLSELLIVMVVIGILAGMSMLVAGDGGSSKTRALGIAAELESAKSATLAYTREHQTRNTDPLVPLVGDANAFKTAIRGYMERSIDKTVKLIHDASSRAYFVQFVDIDADSALTKALDNVVKKSDGYSGGPSGGGKYTLSLKVR